MVWSAALSRASLSAVLMAGPAFAGAPLDACGSIHLRRGSEALELVPPAGVVPAAYLVRRPDDSETVARVVDGRFRLLPANQSDPVRDASAVLLYSGDTVDDLVQPGPGNFCRIKVRSRHGSKVTVFTGQFAQPADVSKRTVTISR